MRRARRMNFKSFFTLVIIHVGHLENLPLKFPVAVAFEEPFPGIGILANFNRRIVGDDVVNQILRAGIADLMRFTRQVNETIAGTDFDFTFRRPDLAMPAQHDIEFPLCRVRMIWPVYRAGRYAREFQIKRMPTASGAGVFLAAKCKRNVPAKQMELSFGRFHFHPLNLILVGLVRRNASVAADGKRPKRKELPITSFATKPACTIKSGD